MDVEHSSGRPKYIRDNQTLDLSAEVEDYEKDTKLVLKKKQVQTFTNHAFENSCETVQFMEKLLVKRRDQLKSYGFHNAHVEEPSATTLRRIYKQADLTNHPLAQRHKQARRVAQESIRNFVTHAAVSLAMKYPDPNDLTKTTPPHLIADFDAVSYHITQEGDEIVVSVARAKKSGEEPMTIVDQQSLGHQVRVYNMIFANGSTHFTLGMADKSIKAGQVHKLVLNGVGQSSTQTTNLYLIKDYKKESHEALTETILSNDVIEFMKKQQDLVRKLGEGEEDSKVHIGGVVYIDGEDAMLKKALKSKKVLSALKDCQGISPSPCVCVPTRDRTNTFLVCM